MRPCWPDIIDSAVAWHIRFSRGGIRRYTELDRDKLIERLRPYQDAMDKATMNLAYDLVGAWITEHVVTPHETPHLFDLKLMPLRVTI